MLTALVTGELFRLPERRAAKSGNPYTVATVKSRDGDACVFVRVLAFSESAQAELMRLTVGETLSAQGALKAETYVKGGETRVSLTILAASVLPLRAARKAKDGGKREPATNPAGEPKRQPEPPRQPTQERHPMDRYGGASGDEFGDDIPF